MPSHRARPHGPRRVYLVLAGTVVILVLAVVAIHIASGGTSLARTDAAAGPAATSSRPSPSRPAPTRSRAARQPASSPATAPSSRAPSQPAPSPPAPTSTGSVLAVINQARAQAGLPAYTITSGLRLSSGRHNQLMASGCGLSHQCPGEPALGDRETAAGVHWTAAGENIGEGGPVADTTAAITQMAVALTQDMLNEKPPDDGHRQNILSSTFTHIGITIQRSADGTVWMTQDFSA